MFGAMTSVRSRRAARRMLAVKEAVRDVKLPPEILSLAGGDSEEFASFVTQVAHLAATCMVNGTQCGPEEVAVIADMQGWTQAQEEMACAVLALNGCWQP